QKMPALLKAGVLFLLAIAHFFYQSGGLSRSYGDVYAFWKSTPLLVLISFVALHGGGIPLKERALLFFALLAGCTGDYVMGLAKEGIVPGAIAFGIGHIFYLITFARNTLSIHWPVTFALLLWNSVIVYFCILPFLKVSVVAVIVMTTYAFLLATTVVFAASQYFYGSSDQSPFSSGLGWRVLGFALFYLSDSIIIVDVTVTVPFAPHLVFVTYFAAQYFLVRGAISCEKNKYHSK
ncbi:hypothetical protein PMAYCL1PPCAC_03127, partial [Pristionchus mayeri]